MSTPLPLPPPPSPTSPPPSPTPPPSWTLPQPLPPATTRGTIPPAAGHHLSSPLQPRWCRLHRHHRHLGCRLHRCHYCQSSRCSFTRSETVRPYPFERFTCPPSHHRSIDPRVRRLYVCYVDRLEQDPLLSLHWVVGARPVEDAARGR